MSLNVFVHGHRVARLETPDGFQHVLTYLPGVATERFISLTMPVQGGNAGYEWPTLHPFFQVSLPEGFLLSVLKSVGVSSTLPRS
jgi:serine/threonine-protein kinase HipA